ncbi:PilN domain-containing protein [Aestuariibius sp. 2305UL40-4]|uniref:PilN domain-containing protein n=1 Tax=Aestuariibius violaceus TaxID=3234132 RepID=UPI00345EE692
MGFGTKVPFGKIGFDQLKVPSTAALEAGWRWLRGDLRAPEPGDVALTVSGGVPVVLGEDGQPIGLDEAKPRIERARHVEIVLPSEECLEIELTLPDASLRELEDMIAVELSVRSPFEEAESLWLWRLEERPGEGWHLRACVILRQTIAPLLTMVEESGYRISRVSLGLGEDALSALPDWAAPAEEAPRGAIPARLRGTVMISAAFLAVALIALSVVQLRHMSLSTEADAARSQIAALAVQDSARRTVGQAAAASQSRLSLPTVLAGRIPAESWLERLTIDGGEVSLTGFTPSAAALSDLLAATPGLSDPRFAAPVTRDNSQGIERFRIDATLTGAGR